MGEYPTQLPLDDALKSAAERYQCTAVRCPSCVGTGVMNGKHCWNCEGAGRLWQHRLGTLSNMGLRRLSQV